ncbi:bifunctional riboflavin kinase/FAD synthetase [Nisaea acidiphila]|uniref:Riboflavin biosynthesis protein n=1 Tax=Nisaea acidiphila TaxID=1862145 RepID=A0A9J7B089_9PROT|nr:bifunctional riboflavin kinase/FAD synthetase [Nisaea acidiphila]UUX51900.1 bifunctional riboflavin kinase/FAD synthetase [Nisaea acidiphila]
MRIIRSLEEVTSDDRGAIAAVGNFDGVHLGHRAVIGQALHAAQLAGAPASVLTFEPHPRMLFQPDAAVFRLTTAALRAEAIAGLGINILFELGFDTEFSHLSAEDFITGILHRGLGLRHVIIGHDFFFGHRRRGTPEMLQEFGIRLGFGVSVIDAVTERDGAVYSSSRVRQCLQEGDPRGAAALLGRPWEVEAEVVHGDRRGRTIGFPTANLQLEHVLHPAHGVYAVRARDTASGTWWNGVANFGRRPTVNDRGPLLEVNLFDVAPDLYGRKLRVQFIDFIRPEMKFSGLDELKAQIARDVEVAREKLSD